MALYRYKCYGLTIASEYDLPELIPYPETAPVDVTIGQTEDMIVDIPLVDGQRLYELSDNVHLFWVDGVAGYKIVSGEKIIIKTASQATPWDIRLYLLSHVMNILLNQRNRFLFHGCAFTKDDHAIMVTGPSVTAGSVLGRELKCQGYPLISDNFNHVEPADDTIWISPGQHASDQIQNETNSMHTPGYRLSEMFYIVTDSRIDNFETENVSGIKKIPLLDDCIFFNRITEKKHNEIFKINTMIAPKCRVSVLRMPEVRFSLDKLMNIVSGGKECP